MSTRSLKSTGVVAVTAGAALLLAACGGQSSSTGTGDATGGESGLSGSIAIDGSSTVAPLSEAAADLFRDVEPGINVTVATSGTGGGFQKFCAGETDISDASRPIKDEEAADCAANGIEFTEIIMANDGLSVVVNPENDWAQCLTIDQLGTIWGPEAEGEITNWNQVDPSFPDQPLALFGAGTDSGTFDYFTDAINGEEGAIRTDYSPSEDDNVTVQGVGGDVGAIGFLGLSYVEENPDSMKAVEVDGGAGCVAPATETVQDGTYTPLGRPLFIYVNNASYADRAEVRAFVDFYVENEAQVAENALFIGLTEDQKSTAQEQLASLVG
ncbi:MAG: PstS family phosphate ABC transporter substrate-binding protein [Actinobacteria bacterium]|nr:PstS family phosphate ABC transporter substrate-binding protein [Actinomycetota bacterium]